MTAQELIIVGDSAFAQIAYHYFNEHTNYKVIAFSIEKQFLKQNELFGLPVVPFEELPTIYIPEKYHVFVAITYGQLNRLRARLADEVKEMGYALASYISPYAYVSKQANLGEHCFVFENNVIQPYCNIGDNVVLWSGNHIGHHSTINSHCFISSHVVVSGFVSIGQYSFLGVNATIVNNISIGNDCWIGPGVVISKDCASGALYGSTEFQPSPVSTHKFFKLNDAT